MPIAIDRLRQAMAFEDLREQPQVTPGTFRLSKESSDDLPRSIVNGSDQTKPGAAAFQPVVRGAIDLQHHPFGQASVSAASGLSGAPLSGTCAPIRTPGPPRLFTT